MHQPRHVELTGIILTLASSSTLFTSRRIRQHCQKRSIVGCKTIRYYPTFPIHPYTPIMFDKTLGGNPAERNKKKTNTIDFHF